MNKCVISPDQTGYSVSMPTGVLVAQVAGGSPRSRLDTISNWGKVAVQWTTSADGYEYLQQLNRWAEANGGGHFLIDLILNRADLTEVEAMIEPGTLTLNTQDGGVYVVAASLLVNVPTDTSTFPIDPGTLQNGALLQDSGDYILI